MKPTEPTGALVLDTSILYRGGYKYQLAENYHGRVDLRVPAPVVTQWFEIGWTGELLIRAGYAWDGPSGPTIDSRTFMRGSLVHDVLYQAIRGGFISAAFKDAADEELRELCLADGMHPWRAWYIWKAVQWQGHKAIQGGPRPIVRAPRMLRQPLRQMPGTVVPDAVAEHPAPPPSDSNPARRS